MGEAHRNIRKKLVTVHSRTPAPRGKFPRHRVSETMPISATSTGSIPTVMLLTISTLLGVFRPVTGLKDMFRRTLRRDRNRQVVTKKGTLNSRETELPRVDRGEQPPRWQQARSTTTCLLLEKAPPTRVTLLRSPVLTL